MLFNVLFVVMVLYTMATPYFYIRAVRFGMSIGEANEAKELTTFHLPKKKKQPVMSDDEKRTMQILQNIDRYDGTPTGQTEIR